MAAVLAACAQLPLPPYQAPSLKLDPDEPQLPFVPSISSDSFDFEAALMDLDFDFDTAAAFDATAFSDSLDDESSLFFPSYSEDAHGLVPSLSSSSLASNYSSASLVAEHEGFPYKVPTAARSRRSSSISRPSAIEAPQELPATSSPSEIQSVPQAATAKPCWPSLELPASGLTRQQRVQRYREKRKRRTFEKTIRYEARRAYAEVRPRIKGRFATKEEAAAIKAARLAGGPCEC